LNSRLHACKESLTKQVLLPLEPHQQPTDLPFKKWLREVLKIRW
jgi:hypothetical protein